MTGPQITLFVVLAAVFGMLLWGRWRYDVVALAGLVVAVAVGVVPAESAFSGFGHPAVVIIALVLVASRGLANSGAIDVLARILVQAGDGVSRHIAAMAGVGALLSSIMNNVGALALLMPLDVQAARRAKRSPALTLMPLSFATILGGLVTLIGTPPNIIVSGYRATALGEPYSMFDFTPVGLACAVAGVAFVALVGWRLIPAGVADRKAGGQSYQLGDYLVELAVGEDSASIGKSVRELDEAADQHDAAIVSLVRGGMRLPTAARGLTIQAGDTLLVETQAESLDDLIKALELKLIETDTEVDETGEGKAAAPAPRKEGPQTGDLVLAEIVVREGALIEGRNAAGLRLKERHGVWLIGISRRGRRLTSRVRHIDLEAGDVLLILGEPDRIRPVSEWMGGLPLAARGLQVTDGSKATLAALIFAGAIVVATAGWLPLPVALAAVAVLYVATSIVPLRELYEVIEWPAIVLIGALIPIGEALETTGGSELIARSLLSLSQGLAPWVVLTLVMVVTMTLSDILNNTATAVVAAPVAVEIARRLEVSPDPFLMAVAVAASCAFLTPIGHKNNMLIMGPGGYRFGDYWRMGLPLEIIVVAVAIPMILLVWPL